jgi:hypothetical protein
VKKATKNFWASSVIKKLPEIKQFPKGRKFSQSGHPGCKTMSNSSCAVENTKNRFFNGKMSKMAESRKWR